MYKYERDARTSRGTNPFDGSKSTKEVLADYLGNIVTGTKTKLSSTKFGKKAIEYITTKFGDKITEILLEYIRIDILDKPKDIKDVDKTDLFIESKTDNVNIKMKPIRKFKNKKE